ncbi:MAG: ribonuclease III [Cyanobacteria bacterium J06621_8]
MEDPRRRKKLKILIQKLGLPEDAPVNWSLLDLALTHPSIDRTNNYEQLEFVGDSVVRLLTAELLLETYPKEPVGEFAAIRSIVVSDRTLAELADSFGLEPYLLISINAKANPAGRQSWLADTFEAVLGALYLSTHNMDLIRPWLDRALSSRSEIVRQDPARFNYKDALQEWTQRKYQVLPQYQVKKNPRDQPEHRFIAEVWLNDRYLGKGSGRSKKASQQAAAKDAFSTIQTDEP